MYITSSAQFADLLGLPKIAGIPLLWIIVAICLLVRILIGVNRNR